MISVVLIDDCDRERDHVMRALATDPEIEVVATADNGPLGVRLAARHRPDVVVMDLDMPHSDGLAATRQIMETNPRPVVIVSDSWDQGNLDGASRAYRAGAVAGARKPLDLDLPDYDHQCAELVRTLRSSAGVDVARLRWRKGTTLAVSSDHRIRVVAIGVSTGGPPVLEALLSRVPARFPAPILVVQHIADGFVEGLVEWLRRVTPLVVQLARDGEVAYGGNVYISPADRHLGIDPGGRLIVDGGDPERSQRPAVSFLFRSVARSYGGECAGVVLTGMGSDGAGELKQLRDLGALTIAQDEGSCTVFGMPGEAIKLGAAQHVLPPERIGDLLCRAGGVANAVVDGATRSPRGGKSATS